MLSIFLHWLNSASLPALGGLLLFFMSAALFVGRWLRKRRERHSEAARASSDTEESYVVSAVLGLLALLMGFTFSLSIDRYETRRALVLQDANAVGTAYLRVQLLPEPHRARLSGLLRDFTENKIALGNAPRDKLPALLVVNNRLLTDIWSADAAAFDAIKGLDFSSTFIDSMNTMIDLDASRKAARRAHVPSAVFGVLFVYLIVTSGVLGFVLGSSARTIGSVLLLLLTLSLLLIIDIDRPTSGLVREDQGTLERLLASMRDTPTQTYDRWRHASP